MLNGLDLFSGIGGLTLALAPWVRPIAYCENDRYAQSVLLSRMASREIANAPIWDDVTTLDARDLDHIDIIYGGFPCQDISCAGRGEGLEGKRSGLFFEIMRLVSDLRPQFVFLENVPAILVRGLAAVLGEFAGRGYDCRWSIVSASEVGAPHLRKRWWILAHTSSAGRKAGGLCNGRNDASSLTSRGPVVSTESSETSVPLADTNNPRAGQQSERPESEKPGPFGADWWATEPDMGRMANGVPARVDRLRGLGNAVVPLCARTAFERLMGLSDCNESKRT